MEDFDVEKFISLIKSKESIWNYKSSVYGDKIQRRHDWISVFKEFVPDIEEKSKEELHDIAREFQGRWRVLRDGFTRSLRKQIKRRISGSSSITTRLYTYHAQLLFLKDLYDDKPLKSKETNILTTEREDILSYGLGERRKSQKRCHRQETSTDDILIEKLTKRLKEDNGSDNRTEEDDDKQFFMCILKDFKKIPDDRKLDAKSDILNIIRHYKNINSNHSQDRSGPILDVDCLRGQNTTRQDTGTDRIDPTNPLDSDKSRHERSPDEIVICLSPETLAKNMKYE